jgi:hypothetical protein
MGKCVYSGSMPTMKTIDLDISSLDMTDVQAQLDAARELKLE